SFYRLQQVNPGFSYDHLTSFAVSLPRAKYADVESREQFYKRLLENLRALPGVESAGAASGLPLGNNGSQTSFTVADRPAPAPGQAPLMEVCLVTPDYFRAMNIPLIRGRYFDDHDDRAWIAGKDLSKLDEDSKAMAGMNAIVIDEEFARKHWPDEDPVGRRIRQGTRPDAPELTVIGVVGRVKMEGLSQDSNRVQGYFPFAQIPRGAMTVIIKASGDPNQLIAAVRQK